MIAGGRAPIWLYLDPYTNTFNKEPYGWSQGDRPYTNEDDWFGSANTKSIAWPMPFN